MEKQSSRIHELDVLRGFAVIIVLLFHYTYHFPAIFTHVYPILSVPWGKLGVHLFFMISGFVIFMTLGKTKKLVDFVVSRFSRIYPTFFFAVLFTFFSIRLLGFEQRTVNVQSLLVNLTMLQDVLHFPPVDAVYWSLTVEIEFYVIMLGIFLLKLESKIEAIGFCWLVLIFLSHAFSFPLQTILISYLLLNYGHLFIFGIICYKIIHGGITKRRLLLLFLCLLAQYMITPFGESLIVTLLAILFVIAVKRKLGVFNNPLTIFLGSISYPLYLVHQNFGYALLLNLNKLGVNVNVAFVFVTIASILIAGLAHVFIEDPLRSKIRGFYGDRMKTR